MTGPGPVHRSRTLQGLIPALLLLLSSPAVAAALEALTSPAPRQGSDRLLVAQSTSAADGGARADAAAGDDPFEYGILWQIDIGSVAPSFLLGTMHVEDPRVTNLPAPVQDAFENSDSLTTEALLDFEQIFMVGTELLLTDGSTLESLIGGELYADVTDALGKRGLMPEIASMLRPWAVALLLSQPRPQSGMFLDRKLYQLARQSGKEVYGLETMSEQLAVFKDMSLADQLILLQEALAELHTVPEIIERLTQAYLQRDLRELSSLANEQLSDSSVQRKLAQELIVGRNKRMVQRMQDRLQEGNAFIAVGALHLPGPDGLLNRLQQLGVTLTRVY